MILTCSVDQKVKVVASVPIESISVIEGDGEYDQKGLPRNEAYLIAPDEAGETWYRVEAYVEDDAVAQTVLLQVVDGSATPTLSLRGQPPETK